MTEQKPDESFVGSGWLQTNAIADAVTTQFGMRPLIMEEIASLRAGEPLAHPFQIQQFADAAEFSQPAASNNFWRLFGGNLSRDFDMVVLRRGMAFQRLEVLRPDLVAELTIPRGQFDQMPDEYFEKLFEAYQTLSQLVSANDPEIAAQPDDDARRRYWLG